MGAQRRRSACASTRPRSARASPRSWPTAPPWSVRAAMSRAASATPSATHAVLQLRQHLLDGRLEMDEFADRVGAALGGARTQRRSRPRRWPACRAAADRGRAEPQPPPRRGRRCPALGLAPDARSGSATRARVAIMRVWVDRPPTVAATTSPRTVTASVLDDVRGEAARGPPTSAAASQVPSAPQARGRRRRPRPARGGCCRGRTARRDRTR